MSFKEKSAWISFGCILLVFGCYYFVLFSAFMANPRANLFDNPELVRWFFAAIIVVIVLEIVLHVLIAIRSPKDAAMPKDERERLIGLKAIRNAYTVMVIATILASVIVVHHGDNHWLLGNVVLMVFVLGELVRFGSQGIYHRRGS
jgi:hypothetical protein